MNPIGVFFPWSNRRWVDCSMPLGGVELPYYCHYFFHPNAQMVFQVERRNELRFPYMWLNIFCRLLLCFILFCILIKLVCISHGNIFLCCEFVSLWVCVKCRKIQCNLSLTCLSRESTSPGSASLSVSSRLSSLSPDQGCNCVPPRHEFAFGVLSGYNDGWWLTGDGHKSLVCKIF